MDGYEFITGLVLCVMLILLMIVIVINYVLTAYPMYKMFQKADIKNPKYAFIPIFNYFKLFNLANLSGWYCSFAFISLFAFFYLFSLGELDNWIYIIYINAFIFAIVLLYMRFKIAQNFGLDTLGCILTMLMPIPAYWYLALSQKQFVGNIDIKYLNNQHNDNQYTL